MVLDYEYGINIGNRFLDLVDHDEDPDEFIATQTHPEEKPKKSTKETKQASSTSNKKSTGKTTTTTPATTGTTNVSSNTTKTNKENLTGKPTTTDQRKQQSNVLSDTNNQQTRIDSGRGSGRRGFPRRGGSAGQDRPAYEGGNRGGGQDRPGYEGGNRGGGQQRSQRFNKFDGQQTANETGGFEQGGDAWGTETTNDNNQSFGSYRGRGRGGGLRRGDYEGRRGNYEGRRGNYEGRRGNYEERRGNYEGPRGGGRGRGRGGRGNFNNRNFEEGSQEQEQHQQKIQETDTWQQNTESTFDNTPSQPARTGDTGQEFDADVSQQDRSFEADNTRRGGRGSFRSRTFRSNRHYGSDRQSQYERDTNEVSQDEYRHNRRQHDRQPRTNVSGVKPIEKKDGEGAHNWGKQIENPEENPVSDEITETTQAPPTSKDWAQQVDEAEKQQITLDEYKKQIEAKKQAQQEKLPQLNRRTAGEGEDPNAWQHYKQVYRKKNFDDESNEEELEEESGGEENESEEEVEEEQTAGKKKIITIPLRFKPIEMPRGPAGSRGGQRRGSGRPYRDRPYRDDQPRPKSPTQETGEYRNTEQQQQQQQQQSRPYRGGSRGSGRNEYRRSYGNSARGLRGGYNRSNNDPNKPDFDNPLDFPNLAKS